MPDIGDIGDRLGLGGVVTVILALTCIAVGVPLYIGIKAGEVDDPYFRGTPCVQIPKGIDITERGFIRGCVLTVRQSYRVRLGQVHRRCTRCVCQRSRVRGVTNIWCRRRRGVRRASADRIARSAHDARGVAACRRRTESW
jgi:hypothetical protein